MNVDISWEWHTPAVASDQSFSWQLERCQSDELEKKLGIPEGTLGVLRQAFALGLSRTTRWKWDTSDACQAALKAGAQLFKRGVDHQGLTPSSHSGSYRIEITNDHSAQRVLTAAENCFLVVDYNCTGTRSWLRERSDLLIEDVSESIKCLTIVADILVAFRESEKPALAVVGGGILADLVAFAASLASAEVVLIPTTLLAMVDACVGGKTGVNFFPFGKNQVGAFYFPKRVHVFTDFLETLPKRHLIGGFAECMKHAWIEGDLGFQQTLATVAASDKLLTKEFLPLVPRLIHLKARVVERDPTEKGERVTLNLGHTLAHALEGLSQQNLARDADATISHGEAVGLGLVYCSLLAETTSGSHDQLRSTLARSGCVLSREALQRRLGETDRDKIWNRLQVWLNQDKKIKSSRVVKWVLPGPNGRPQQANNGEWVHERSRDETETAWRRFWEFIEESGTYRSTNE